MKKILSVVIAAVLCFAFILPAFAQGIGAGGVSTVAKAANKKITLKGTFIDFKYGADNINNMLTMTVKQVSPKKFKKALAKKNVIIALNDRTNVKGDPAHTALPNEFTIGDKLNVQVKVAADGTLVAKKVLNLTLKQNAEPVEDLSDQGAQIMPETGGVPEPAADADGYYEGTAMSADAIGNILLVQINGHIYNVLGEGEVKYLFNGVPGAALSIIQFGDVLKIKGKFCTETKNIYATEVRITHNMP